MSTGMISPPGGVAETPLRTECRVYPRHAVDVNTSCQPAGNNEMRWEAVVRDVSQGGVRLVLRRRFERNTCLAMELPGKAGEDAYTVFVRVVHLLSLGGGTWALGCKFISELSDEELDRLVNWGRPEPQTDSGVISGVRLQVENADGVVARCRIARFHVCTHWPLEPGQTIHLHGVPIAGKRDRRSFVVLGCEPEDGGWQLRVELPDAPFNAIA